MTDAPSRIGERRWPAFFISWVLLSLMAAAWSLATPISGAPDEPAHAVKAASVVRGEFVGANSKDGQLVQVPAYIAFTYEQTCYAFHSNVTAKCSERPISGDPGKTVTTATRAGLYNPSYYAIVGWPSLVVHDDLGIYLMRAVSAVVSSLFLAFSFMMIWTWRRRLIPLLGFAVALTPMIFFLNGSINPNSLEVTGTLAAFIGMLSIIREPNRALLTQRGVIVAVSAVTAVNTRGLSPLWVGIAVLVPLLLTTRGQLRELLHFTIVRVAIACVALGTVAAIAWTLGSNSLGAGIADPDHPVTGAGVGGSPLSGFARIFAGTFEYGQGLIGVFGWLDTPAPAAVFFTWSAFIGSLVVLSLVLLRGKAFAVSLSLIAGLVLIPPLIQAAYINGGGLIWQGRYALPLYVCLIVALSLFLSEKLVLVERRSQTVLVILILGVWTLAQLYSFATAVKRYAVGAPGTSWKKMFFDPDWAPPGGVPVSLLGCAVIFVVAAVLLGRVALTNRSSDEADVLVRRDHTVS